MISAKDVEKLHRTEESISYSNPNSLIRKYDIPLNHLDFDYIKKCTNGRELEKIVQILRSGEEGYYPDLLRETEIRLAEIKPKSKLLRVTCPVLRRESLTKEENKQIEEEMTDWVNNISQNDNKLGEYRNMKIHKNSLPNIRQIKELKAENNNDKKVEKRIGSTDYSSWDKYDVDTEIMKMDLEDEKKKNKITSEKTKPKKKAAVQFQKFTTDIEAEYQANYEKDKGNEYFKAKDYKRALFHYNNSISCKPTIPGYNNRALVYLKMEKYKNSLDDCISVLSVEPENVKALTRKSQALEGLGKFKDALRTIEEVIKLEPNNTFAQELAQKFREQTGTILKNTKMMITDEITDNNKKEALDKNENSTGNIVNKIETDEIDKNKKSAKLPKIEDTNKKPVRKKKDSNLIIPIPGTSSSPPPHFYICPKHLSDEKHSLGLIRANLSPSILKIIPVDSMEDDEDDCCTINHLKHICSGNIVNNVKPDKSIHNKDLMLEKEEISINTDYKESKEIQQENIIKEVIQKPSSTNSVIRTDKQAGGEPCIKQESFEISPDIHSPYNFLKAWNSAGNDYSLEHYSVILKTIDMDRVVDLIGCKMDSSMFTNLIRCLCMHFTVPGEVDKLYSILENIVRLPRFDIISLLMSEDDKKNVNLLVNFLRQHGKYMSKDTLTKLNIN